MGYVNVKVSPTPYTPALFIKQDREFNPKTTDRKRWLRVQLINIEFAIFKYQGALLDLSNQAAQLDGKSDAAMWMQQLGVIALNLGNSGLTEIGKGTSGGMSGEGGFGENFSKYSAIAGAALIAAGVVINIFKKKSDDRKLQELYQQAISLGADVKMLESMRQRYQTELTRMTILPVLLFGTAAYIASND